MDACPQGESKKKQIVLSSSSAGAGAMTTTYCRGGGFVNDFVLQVTFSSADGCWAWAHFILKDRGREGRQVGILITCSCSVRTDGQISAMLMLDFDLEGGFDPA